MSLKRMRIADPSKLQSFYGVGGEPRHFPYKMMECVLTDMLQIGEQGVRIYYTKGTIISEMIPVEALIEGWGLNYNED